ncbi:unnamed protein product [marine sediment metagenome]|uniref:Uncharacterized protein n=1 Tax=marine sediment metagenome TaxID=412755 RepID=X0RZ08_9ZZZZ
MKKASKPRPVMRSEYDFSKGKRGKYAARYARGANVVLLDPDVSEVFPDAKSVNQALRAIAKIVRTREGARSTTTK